MRKTTLILTALSVIFIGSSSARASTYAEITQMMIRLGLTTSSEVMHNFKAYDVLLRNIDVVVRDKKDSFLHRRKVALELLEDFEARIRDQEGWVGFIPGLSDSLLPEVDASLERARNAASALRFDDLQVHTESVRRKIESVKNEIQ